MHNVMPPTSVKLSLKEENQFHSQGLDIHYDRSKKDVSGSLTHIENSDESIH